MNFSLTNYRRLNPNTDGGGGGGAPAGGAPAGGAPAGAGAPAPGGQPGGAPQYVSAADLRSAIEPVLGKISEFGRGLQEFRTDYDSRFAPRGGGAPANDEPTVEPRLDDPKYAGQDGVQKFLADFNRFHTAKNWKAFQAEADKTSKAQGLKQKRAEHVQAYMTSSAEARARYKDFDTVMQNGPGELPDGRNGSPDVLTDVMESEHRADLLYFLSKFHGEYWKLLHEYGQSEKRGYAALKMLENRFATEAAERKRARIAAGAYPTGGARTEFDGGAGDDDQKYTDMARQTWGLKPKNKE